jgi:hypothetical protein
VGIKLLKKGYRNFAKMMFVEAKRNYKEIMDACPPMMRIKDYGNLGSIDAIVEGFSGTRICVLTKFRASKKLFSL